MTITYQQGGNLYVNVTNRCSNSCTFCIRSNGPGVGDADDLWLEREPTREEILADILKRDLGKYRDIVFCGYGEPLERLDDVVWVCRNLKQKHPVHIRVNTNGQADLIHGRGTAADLAGAVDCVSVSLNASNAKDYQNLCRSQYGEKAFDAVIAYAADCKKYVPEVMLSVVDVISPGEIEECRKIAQKAGVPLRVREKI